VDDGRGFGPDLSLPTSEVTDWSRRGWWIGLAGVALLLAGSGWYQVWVGPPYRYADEQAHVGYVLEVQRGHLPTIDSPIDEARGGQALRDRLRIEPPRRRTIWVANNPPLPYVLAAGPSAITRALGWPGGPLLGLRLTNLLCMVGATVAAACLGANLAGGDRRVGLVAGGLFAATPHLGFIAGIGVTDGPAMLFSVLAMDALVTICRGPATPRRVALLGLWCGLGAACRPMTAVLCGACALMAFGVVLIRTPAIARRLHGPAPEPEPETESSPSTPKVLGVAALLLFLPALVLSGWWYLRNIHLYGDATGSQFLFEKFLRTRRSGPLTMIHYPSVWREVLRTLFVRRLEHLLPTDLGDWWPVLKVAIIASIVGAAGLVVADQVRARRRGDEPATSALAWAAAAALVVVDILLIAQHWSGGGGTHARYAFPALIVLLTASALCLVRLGTRVAGAAMIVLQLAIQAHQVPLATTWVAQHRAGAARTTLTFSVGPEWLRMSGIPVIVLGTVALLVGLVLVAPVRRPGAAAVEAEGTDLPVPPP
jgi:hypothetical protein